MNDFGKLLQIVALINTIRSFGTGWQVFHHQGPGDLDESTALRLTEGKISIGASSREMIFNGSFKEGGKTRKLRGGASFIGKEVIQLDGRDVDGDDLYYSVHRDGDDPRIILEYRFTDGGIAHRYRFKKSLGGVL